MQRKKLILFHVLFWVIVYLKGNVLFLTSQGLSVKFQSLNILSAEFAITMGYLSITMLAFYGAYMIVKKILVQRKFIPAVLYVLLLLVSLIAFRAFIEFAIFKPFLNYNNYPANSSALWKYFIPNVIFYYWDFVIYGTALAFFMHWLSVERARREQESLTKTAQLSFLQSQINPHFLFNTINDIYALSLKKSDKTPGALMQLSGLLRYALYDNKDPLVPLHKELNYIRNYLELQRTGYDNIFYVDFETEGEPDRWQVPPMILLPFVENACKHGVTNDCEHPVVIRLKTDFHKLLFQVTNRVRLVEKDSEGGIGIGNIQKRLELLYPDHHQLHIKAEQDSFSIELQITQ